MTTIQIRVDKETKESAKKVLDELGLDMSAAIKLYLRQISITKGIPFQIRTENGFTPEQEREILESSEEAIREIKAGKRKVYTSVDKMMEDLLK